MMKTLSYIWLVLINLLPYVYLWVYGYPKENDIHQLWFALVIIGLLTHIGLITWYSVAKAMEE